MCRIEIEQFVNKITGDFYLFNSYCKFTLSYRINVNDIGIVRMYNVYIVLEEVK